MDYSILSRLTASARTSWADLAGELGLSAPAAAERVRRLERRGVVRGYAALVEPEAVGYPLLAFIAVSVDEPRHREAFLARVRALTEVQECHHVAGEDDYLLKVRCRDTGHLERVISREIKGVPGGRRTRTVIVLSTTKESPAVPLDGASGVSGGGRAERVGRRSGNRRRRA